MIRRLTFYSLLSSLSNTANRESYRSRSIRAMFIQASPDMQEESYHLSGYRKKSFNDYCILELTTLCHTGHALTRCIERDLDALVCSNISNSRITERQSKFVSLRDPSVHDMTLYCNIASDSMGTTGSGTRKHPRALCPREPVGLA